jgi:hypothetical protein
MDLRTVDSKERVLDRLKAAKAAELLAMTMVAISVDLTDVE